MGYGIFQFRQTGRVEYATITKSHVHSYGKLRIEKNHDKNINDDNDGFFVGLVKSSGIG